MTDPYLGSPSFVSTILSDERRGGRTRLPPRRGGDGDKCCQRGRIAAPEGQTLAGTVRHALLAESSGHDRIASDKQEGHCLDTLARTSCNHKLQITMKLRHGAECVPPPAPLWPRLLGLTSSLPQTGILVQSVSARSYRLRCSLGCRKLYPNVRNAASIRQRFQAPRIRAMKAGVGLVPGLRG